MGLCPKARKVIANSWLQSQIIAISQQIALRAAPPGHLWAAKKNYHEKFYLIVGLHMGIYFYGQWTD